MSWSVNVKGRDPDDVKTKLQAAKVGSPGLPDNVIEACTQTCSAFDSQRSLELARQYDVSTYGHVDEASGVGNATINLNVIREDDDPKTASGAQKLAGKMKSGAGG